MYPHLSEHAIHATSLGNQLFGFLILECVVVQTDLEVVKADVKNMSAVLVTVFGDSEVSTVCLDGESDLKNC